MDSSLANEWSRREFLSWLTLAGCAGLIGLQPWQATAEPSRHRRLIQTTQERTINVRWITEESNSENASRTMEAEGIVTSVKAWEPDADTLEEFGDSQLEPMMIIVGVVAAGWLIKRVSDILLDWKRPGGMLIDATGNELLVRPAPRARRGALVVLTKEGTRPHVFLPEERDEGLKELARILGASNG